MKKLIALMMICLVMVTAATAQSKDELAVRNVLALQTNQWNSGDIPGFMQTYWKSDSLMFIGKSGITYGWQQTLDNYKKGYPDTAAMGQLSFELLEVKQLLPAYFFVVGKWQLARSIGNVGGVFTLLFRYINKRWVIVADHSS